MIEWSWTLQKLKIPLSRIWFWKTAPQAKIWDFESFDHSETPKKSPAAPENTYELSEGGVSIKWVYELSECMNYLSENNNKENRG